MYEGYGTPSGVNDQSNSEGSNSADYGYMEEAQTETGYSRYSLTDI